jgi:hypothetical protein
MKGDELTEEKDAENDDILERSSGESRLDSLEETN